LCEVKSKGYGVLTRWRRYGGGLCDRVETTGMEEAMEILEGRSSTPELGGVGTEGGSDM